MRIMYSNKRKLSNNHQFTYVQLKYCIVNSKEYYKFQISFPKKTKSYK